jgi:lipid-binding SYLF domain-containing protein
MQRFTAALTLVLALVFSSSPALADDKTDKRLQESRKVFESFTDLSEQSVPTWMLQRAYGIVVVPQVIKGAVFFGGRGGRGVMSVRNPDGSWSDPVFVTLGGGSFGFQFGVQSSDVVLILMSRKSVEGISGGKVTLGADASVAAGPLGRSASANTDATLKAQVLSYARSEGLFFGVALDGSVISVDDKSNAAAYGMPDVYPSQILEGKITSPPQAAVEFKAALTRATEAADAVGAAQAAVPAATATPATPATKPAAPAAPAAPKDGDEAKTYPMEDPQPGAPPPP